MQDEELLQRMAFSEGLGNVYSLEYVFFLMPINAKALKCMIAADEGIRGLGCPVTSRLVSDDF